MDKALNRPASNLVCRDTGSIQGRPIFFFRSVSLHPSETKISILKQIAFRARSEHSFFAQVIVMYESIERQSKYHSDRRKRDVMH